LAKVIKKTTGYDLIDLEPLDPDTIDVNDNEINTSDVTDINIATDKRHKELQKDFDKQMKEGLPKLKDLVL
jgi:hypothetical protein